MDVRFIGKKFSLGVFLSFVLMAASLSTALAQQEEEQEQQVPYTQEEYNTYQAAVEKGNSAILQFIEDHPDSQLNQYAITAYMQNMQKVQNEGNHQDVVAMGEKFLDTVDSDRFEVLYLTTWSSFYSQQYAKAVEHGEKVYASKPDAPQLEPILARSYSQVGNQEKFIQFAQKVCAEEKPENCIDMLPSLMRHFFNEKDWNAASKYASQTLEGLKNAKKSEGASEQEWNKFVRSETAVAHAIMGRSAYENGNWSQTKSHFARSMQADGSSKERNAEGYYYIGMSHWKEKKIDPAMEAFAKGSVIKGTPFTQPNRANLEKLYKSTHNDSLAGLEEFISRVAG